MKNNSPLSVVTIDLETYWATDHSLSKMNPIEYVMHPDTEIQSMAIKVDHWPTDVFFTETRIKNVLSNFDWSNKIVVAHNGSGFDHMLLRWRLGVKPKLWACTLAMARPFYGLTCGVSLQKVSEALGIGGKKDADVLINTKGRRLQSFTADELKLMQSYNKQDTELCYKIFCALAPKLGKHEMKLIDMTVRMLVEPQFEADIELLTETLAGEQQRKRKALLELAAVAGIDTPEAAVADDPNTLIAIAQHGPEEAIAQAARDIAMSQPKFAALLEKLGVPCPMKPSLSDPDKLIPALAKTDVGLQELTEHEDYRVQVAANTRLGVKSTQLETRMQSFLTVAAHCGGMLPVPLNYCGATISWRMSGAMKLNMQNNTRVNKKAPKPSDALRYSMKAPKGRVVVVVDSSNIELRVAHALAGQKDTVAKLVNKEDLYCWFASTLYGREITKKDEAERFIGKVAMLSLQYGAGWSSFQGMARILSGGKMLIPEDECKRIVQLWRGMFPAIAGRHGIWKSCDAAIEAMHLGNTHAIDPVGLLTTAKERINTPNNHWLQYPGLHQNLNTSTKKTEWVYGEGRNRSRLYGSHLYENICQHLARLIVMEQSLELDKRYPLALSAHDEGVILPLETEADEAKAYAELCFSTPPKWWPDLPVACEAGVGYTYGQAK